MAWPFTVALAFALPGGGCQRVLGIHDSHLASSGGAGGTTGGGTGGRPGDASTADARDGDAGTSPGPDASATGGASSGGASSGGAMGSGATGGAGGAVGGVAGRSGTGGAGAVGGGIDAGTGGEPSDAGPSDASAPDASGGAGGAGTPPTDARPDTGGDGAQNDGRAADAGTCTSPWQATGVEARLLTPDPTGMTACSMAGGDIPTLAAAVDATNYRGGQACGACLRVQAALGTASVVVPVVEKSGASGVLLTKAAMEQIAPGASLTMVDWTLVACDVQQRPVHYYIKDGSNAGYVGIQVRDARYPIATVVAVGAKTSVSLALQPYDYWESTSAGAGPLTLRLTDINGQSFDDPGIKIAPQTDMAGAGQFPLCH